MKKRYEETRGVLHVGLVSSYRFTMERGLGNKGPFNRL